MGAASSSSPPPVILIPPRLERDLSAYPGLEGVLHGSPGSLSGDAASTPLQRLLGKPSLRRVLDLPGGGGGGSPPFAFRAAFSPPPEQAAGRVAGDSFSSSKLESGEVVHLAVAAAVTVGPPSSSQARAGPEGGQTGLAGEALLRYQPPGGRKDRYVLVRAGTHGGGAVAAEGGFGLGRSDQGRGASLHLTAAAWPPRAGLRYSCRGGRGLACSGLNFSLQGSESSASVHGHAASATILASSWIAAQVKSRNGVTPRWEAHHARQWNQAALNLIDSDEGSSYSRGQPPACPAHIFVCRWAP